MPSKHPSVVALTPAARIAIFFAVSGCGDGEALPPETPERLTMELRSPAFAHGGAIPSRFTCDGSNESLSLRWSGVLEESRSLVLLCDDPDAPMGTWSHWVAINLPAQLSGLKEGVPAEETIPISSIEGSPPAISNLGAPQGKNDFGKNGYGGPCPPSGTHRYFFWIYALNAKLGFGASATRANVLEAIRTHVLAEGRLTGKYSRGGGKG